MDCENNKNENFELSTQACISSLPITVILICVLNLDSNCCKIVVGYVRLFGIVIKRHRKKMADLDDVL